MPSVNFREAAILITLTLVSISIGTTRSDTPYPGISPAHISSTLCILESRSFFKVWDN